MTTTRYSVKDYIGYALVLFVILTILNALLYRGAIHWSFLMGQFTGLLIGKIVMDFLLARDYEPKR